MAAAAQQEMELTFGTSTGEPLVIRVSLAETELNLSSNKLTTLPREIGNLVNLKTLGEKLRTSEISLHLQKLVKQERRRAAMKETRRKAIAEEEAHCKAAAEEEALEKTVVPSPSIAVVAKEPSIPPPAPPVAAAKPTLLHRPSAARITETPVTAVAGLHAETTPFDQVFDGFIPPTLGQALLGAGIKEGDVKVLLGECSKIAQSAKAKEAMCGTQLTTADVEALAMYTFSFGETEEDMSRNPFRVINLALHWQDVRLQKACGLIFLLLRALCKLPRVSKLMLYRGINSHLDTETYAEGKTITWAGFSLTSTSLSMVKRFLETKTADGAGTCYFAGTLFIITNAWGYDLQLFSRFDDEHEVLFKPGVVLRVNGVMEMRNSHSTVELEMDSCPLLLSNPLPPSFKP